MWHGQRSGLDFQHRFAHWRGRPSVSNLRSNPSFQPLWVLRIRKAENRCRCGMIGKLLFHGRSWDSPMSTIISADPWPRTVLPFRVKFSPGVANPAHASEYRDGCLAMHMRQALVAKSFLRHSSGKRWHVNIIGRPPNQEGKAASAPCCVRNGGVVLRLRKEVVGVSEFVWL